MKLPWLLDRSVRNVFPSSLYCLILIRCIVFIASAKIREREGNSFYGQLPDYKPQLLAYLPSGWVPLFVTAVCSPQTYTAVRDGAQFSVCGVFEDDQANGGWFLLGFDAKLDVWYGFWEHLHSLREVKGLQNCSKTL